MSKNKCDDDGFLKMKSFVQKTWDPKLVTESNNKTEYSHWRTAIYHTRYTRFKVYCTDSDKFLIVHDYAALIKVLTTDSRPIYEKLLKNVEDELNRKM